jgi:glycosyltransferase involved in cell wall biosynthesis
MDRWIADGHEVQYEPGFCPKRFQWCDVYFVDSADNNMKRATTDLYVPGKKLYTRLLDVEYWVGHPGGINWSRVDGLIFINDKIKERTLNEYNVGNTKVKVIKCGIDLSKFTFDPNKQTNNKIAYVVGKGRIYGQKRLDDAIRILYQARKRGRDFTLHILGTDSKHLDYITYCNSLIEKLGLENAVFKTDYVPDVNQWLEDKTYLISPGVKEAFGFAIGEAMAKGIKPIINNFWGAEDLWPEELIYSDFEEAVQLLYGDVMSASYRSYVKRNYDYERFYKEMNEFMEIE